MCGYCYSALDASSTALKRVIAGVAPMRLEDIQLLARLAESGALKPVIDRRYPLADAAQAHAYVDQGHKSGSVVLSVRPQDARASTESGPPLAAAG